MDLSVVKEKLHSLQYTSVVDFLKDIRLMLNNCKTFNKVQNRFFFSIRQVNRGGNQTADVEKLSLSNCPLWIRQTCLLQARFDLTIHINPFCKIQNYLLSKSTSLILLPPYIPRILMILPGCSNSGLRYTLDRSLSGPGGSNVG